MALRDDVIVSLCSRRRSRMGVGALGHASCGSLSDAARAIAIAVATTT